MTRSEEFSRGAGPRSEAFSAALLMRWAVGKSGNDGYSFQDSVRDLARKHPESITVADEITPRPRARG